jgi:hypothetical protein
MTINAVTFARLARSLNAVAFVVFSVFAALQWNDPDMVVWVMLYGYAAMLALFAALHVQVLLPASLGMIGYSLVAWRLFPAELTQSWIEIERAREALSLGVCAAWTAFIAITQVVRARSD